MFWYVRTTAEYDIIRHALSQHLPHIAGFRVNKCCEPTVRRVGAPHERAVCRSHGAFADFGLCRPKGGHHVKINERTDHSGISRLLNLTASLSATFPVWKNRGLKTDRTHHLCAVNTLYGRRESLLILLLHPTSHAKHITQQQKMGDAEGILSATGGAMGALLAIGITSDRVVPEGCRYVPPVPCT